MVKQCVWFAWLVNFNNFNSCDILAKGSRKRGLGFEGVSQFLSKFSKNVCFSSQFEKTSNNYDPSAFSETTSTRLFITKNFYKKISLKITQTQENRKKISASNLNLQEIVKSQFVYFTSILVLPQISVGLTAKEIIRTFYFATKKVQPDLKKYFLIKNIVYTLYHTTYNYII